MSQKMSKAMAVNEIKHIIRMDDKNGERNYLELQKIIFKYMDDNKGRAVADAYREAVKKIKVYD